ncbi:MAG: twin-arginine translocation signal domain-containing protein [Solirubrobacteraceae bacterium]
MSTQQDERGTDRRQFLGRTAATGAGMLVGASALEALVPSFAAAKGGGVTKGDLAIIGAAQIAEALAVTYTNIIDKAPFFRRLASDDQGYLKAARARPRASTRRTTTATSARSSGRRSQGGGRSDPICRQDGRWQGGV